MPTGHAYSDNKMTVDIPCLIFRIDIMITFCLTLCLTHRHILWPTHNSFF